MGPRRVLEGKKLFETYLLKYIHRIFEIRFTFTRKPYDDIGRDRCFGTERTYLLTAVEEILFGISALHSFEQRSRTALQRYMYLFAYLRIGSELFDECIIHMQRVRRSESDTLQPFYFRYLSKQACEVDLFFNCTETSSVVVDILSQKHHLFGTRGHCFADLPYQKITGDGDLITSCCRHDAEST